MHFKMSVEIGTCVISVSGPWKFSQAREVKSWWIKVGPVMFTRKNLPFDRDAAGRVFDALDAGPTGRLSRAYKPT